MRIKSYDGIKLLSHFVNTSCDRHHFCVGAGNLKKAMSCTGLKIKAGTTPVPDDLNQNFSCRGAYVQV